MATQFHGAVFSRSTDGTTFTAVAGFLEFEPHEISRGSVETTTLDQSTDAGYKKFDPSKLKDAGSISVTLGWDEDETGQAALKGDLDYDGNRYYRVLYPDDEDGQGCQVTFQGHITSWGQATPQEDRITRSIGIKITGKPVVAMV